MKKSKSVLLLIFHWNKETCWLWMCTSAVWRPGGDCLPPLLKPSRVNYGLSSPRTLWQLWPTMVNYGINYGLSSPSTLLHYISKINIREIILLGNYGLSSPPSSASFILRPISSLFLFLARTASQPKNLLPPCLASQVFVPVASFPFFLPSLVNFPFTSQLSSAAHCSHVWASTNTPT